MIEGTFNPVVTKTTIALTLKCKKCGCEFTTDVFDVPFPNFNADNQEESEVYEEYEFCCECDDDCDCQKVYTINIYSGMYGGTFDIDDNDELELINMEIESKED
ncbi:MAG: hypothetical protein MJ009_03210 [Paludibacteraceae bacterium]|nr:hypothetical protein [Paludibacteraceae bacterium]